MPEEVQHLHVSYNDIHNLIRRNTPKIVADFDPTLLIAIGLSLFSIIYPYILIICLGGGLVTIASSRLFSDA